MGEFTTAMASSETRALMEEVGLDIQNAELFFQTLEQLSSKSEVSIDNFVEGCLHVRGPAAALDVQILRYDVRKLATDLQCLLASFTVARQCEEAKMAMLSNISNMLSACNGLRPA